jgi:hypothetical protein
MKQSTQSTLGYLGSVVAASVAAALMSGNARADTPTPASKAPFVSEHSLGPMEESAMYPPGIGAEIP